MQLNEVCAIGILGMGGIGKTTIAEEVFDSICGQFDACSFVSKVREVSEKKGLVHLQKQLISDILMESNVDLYSIKNGIDIMSKRFRTKRVLIILDDVTEFEQLQALCGHGWFGPGSKVLITSRDRQLLLTYGIRAERIYSVRLLSDAEALQLFSWKSFKKDQVEEEFLQLSKRVVEYANGLPLAVGLLGSLVFGKNLKVWESALDRLKKNHTKKIVDVYKISYDALENTEKEVFLDIACFFKGEDKDRVIRILESKSGYSPDIDIEVLMDKSIINLLGRKLELHDRIQELGWDIVRQQKPNKRNRLWVPEDIINLLKNNEGTTAVETLLLESAQQENVCFSVDPFSKMSRLRLLKIKNVHLLGDIKCLSNELQLLEWHACPLNSLPSDFQTDKLVELKLQSSSIKELWRGNKRWRMLGFIDMSYSQYLMKTPDFSEVPNLETLVFEGCIRLFEVHPSIGVLKKLRLWNMRNCKSVKCLPPFLGLDSLEILILSACSKLKNFPEIHGYMQRLSELHMDGTAVEKLPQSIDHLTGLTFWNLTDCKNLFSIPTTIRYLKSLKRLKLTGCYKLGDDISADLSCVECLEELDITGTAIRDLKSIERMKNLKSLSLNGYRDSPPKSWDLVVLSCLGILKSSNASLRLLLPSFSRLPSLAELSLNDCNLMDGAIPDDLGNLAFLKRFNLSGNNFVQLPDSISQLTKLQYLSVRNCSKLQSLPKNLPLSLRDVNAEDCQSLTDYPDQFKVWTSSTSGMTTISSIISSKHQSYSRNSATEFSHSHTWIASTMSPGRSIFSLSKISDNYHVWKLVENLSLPNQVLRKQLELLDYKTFYISSGCHEDEIPEWFNNRDAGRSIGIRILPGLKNVEQWMGVSVVFLVKGHPFVTEMEHRSETSNYFYKCTVGTEDFQLDPIPLDWNNHLGSLTFTSHFLFFFYVPCIKFPGALNQSRLLWAVFETNHPCMEVEKCGIRLLFEQGIAEFIETFLPPAFRIVDRRLRVIFPEGIESETLDQASTDSGWLNLQIHGTLQWEKLIPIRTKQIQLKRNIESVLLRIVQELKQRGQHFDFLTSGCPAWFNPEVGEQVLIRLPPHENLYKNKKWMGLALCASFVVDKHTVNEDYQVSCRLQRARSHTVGFNMSLDCRTIMMPGTHQLLVLYIPRASIPEQFIKASSEEMCTVYTTRSAGVRVQLCGLRLLYSQDLPEFVQTISHCIFRSLGAPAEVVYDKLIKDRISMIRLPRFVTPRQGGRITKQEGRKFQSITQSYSSQDWSACHLACAFPGIEIPEWFENVGNTDTAQIQLSPSLIYDGSWIGVAVCASLSMHEHQNTHFDESAHHDLYCFLASNENGSGDVLRFTYPTDNEMWSHACDFVSFVYLPRVLFPRSWNQSDELYATIGSSSSGLGVENCTIRLVFKEDVNDLVQMLSLCQLHAHCPHCETG